jgi:leucyl aminopeptidase
MIALTDQVLPRDTAFSNQAESDHRFAADPDSDSLITDCLKEIDSASIKGFIQELVDFKTRFMLADNRRDIAVWIENKFKSFGITNVVIDSFQNKLEFPLKSGEYATTWQYNVIATLDGREPSDSLYVLGAHYDCFIMGSDTDPYTFCPGADNNASGMAVCLEIARIMTKMNFRPKHSIAFIGFGAEEFMTMYADGPSGSEHYVDNLKKSGRTVAMMIDNNQVAYAPASEPWKLDFQNCPGSGWVTDLAHDLCRRYTGIVAVDTDDHIGYSDVNYFWKAGFPAIFFEEYHFSPDNFTTRDVPENLNMAYCAEVAKISLAMLVYCNR